MFKIFLLITVIFFIACNSQKTTLFIACTDTTTINSARVLSFKELRSIKDINGKLVTMEGYFSYNFEDVALYEREKSSDGVWLSGNIFNESDSVFMKLNGKKVSITGTIDLSRKGHLGFYLCTLSNIICIKQFK